MRPILVVLAAVTCAVRLALTGRDLPYYSIDENEVVEPALAFLCGSRDPHWFGYGPLASYALAGLFWAWKVASRHALGWSDEDFFHAAFFSPSSFYVIARVLHSAASVAAAAVMWAFARRHYDGATARAALALGLAPLLEANAGYTARVDTFQGLLVLSALFFASLFPAAGRRAASHLAAGALAGLSLAVKPLQGLLLLPVLAIAGLHAAWRGSGGLHPGRILRHPGILALWPAVLAAHTIANPYSVLRPAALWTENVRLVGVARPGSVAGHDYAWLPEVWGGPLAAAFVITLIAAWRWKDAPSRLLLAAVALFCAVLLFTPTRPYWYNAILPAALVLVARLVGSAGRLLGRALRIDASLAAVLLAIGLVAAPLASAAGAARDAWPASASFERRADRSAQRWIEANVPAGSRLLMVGYYSMNLPRLAAKTRDAHARWGEFFMYARGQNAGWVEAFRKAYRRHRRQGSRLYEVVNVRRNYGDRDPDPERNRRMNVELAELARAEGARYLVTASPQAFRGRWESDAGVRLLATFGAGTGHTGDEVKVFEVSPAP